MLTTAGIAPIEVGSPVPEEEAAALVTQTSEGCAEPYWRTNPAYDVDDATWGPGSAFAIGTDAETEQVRVVEVMSPQIRTEKGIHIGMPGSELYPLYPEIRRETMGAATVWIIDEVDPGSTTSAGIVLLEVVDDRVAHMRAIMRGIEPYSIARTDGYVIGECAD